MAQGIERIGALHYALSILAAINNRSLIGCREEVHTILIKKRVEVVEHICRSITILRHEDMYTTCTSGQSRRIKRKSPTDQILKMDGNALFAMFFKQRLEGL